MEFPVLLNLTEEILMAVKKRVKRAKKVVAKKPAKKTTIKKTTKKTAKKTVKKPAKRGRKPAAKKAVKKTVKGVKKAGRKKAVKKKVNRNVTAKKAGPKRAKKRAKAGSLAKKTKTAKTKSSSTKKSTPKKSKITNALNAIKEYLTDNGIMFEVIKHSPSITAPQTAASAHISGSDLAKTVIVKADDRMVMVVEPANDKVDLESLKHQIHALSIELANESDFRDLFPSCELGAMPPLGNLYGLEVYIAEALTHNDKIAFNAGTHSELIRVSYEDFVNLVEPKVIYS